MPKILVLFAGPHSNVADAIADGARAVRFSEVELRRVASGAPGDASLPGGARELAGVEELIPYDAIVMASTTERGDLDDACRRLLDEAAVAIPRAALQHKVGSAFPSHIDAASASVWPALGALGDVGMLIVAPAGADLDAATGLGGRVAQVAAWIAHERSHHHHAH